MPLARRGSTPWKVAAALVAAVSASASPAQGDEASSRSDLRRSLREYLFLNAQLGLAHRRALYAEDSAGGPTSQSQLRVNVSGQANNIGPLGAYVGLGFILRPSRDASDVGDPFADRYDEFEFSRNFRLYGAYAEYTLRDEERRPTLRLRAGRIATLDKSANLLLCDGLQAKVTIARRLSIEAYGGRRATLDAGLADQRTDLPVQLCAGASAEGRFGRLRVDGGYRFEHAHRPTIGVRYLGERLGIGARSELILPSDTRATSDPAVVARVDGDFRTSDDRFALTWLVEAQFGDDPRMFGRGSSGPRPEDIQAATRVTVDQGTLDRLFFGSEQPNLRAQLTAEQWITAQLSLQGGAFLRVPFDTEDRQSLRPQIIEGWLGPELSFARGYRGGAEVTFSSEDPGASDRIFSTSGDGVRQRGALRGWAEIPLPLNERMTIAVRPELEVNLVDHRGPLSETDNQFGIAGGGMLTWVWDAAMRVAARYSFESLPEFGADGVDAVHGIELWLEGTY